VFAKQGSAKQRSGLRDKSWCKLIKISSYREKFPISFETQQEFPSIKWQNRKNLRALPTASLFYCRQACDKLLYGFVHGEMVEQRRFSTHQCHC
jgi:hypothetical protein